MTILRKDLTIHRYALYLTPRSMTFTDDFSYALFRRYIEKFVFHQKKVLWPNCKYWSDGKVLCKSDGEVFIFFFVTINFFVIHILRFSNVNFQLQRANLNRIPDSKVDCIGTSIRVAKFLVLIQDAAKLLALKTNCPLCLQNVWKAVKLLVLRIILGREFYTT